MELVQWIEFHDETTEQWWCKEISLLTILEVKFKLIKNQANQQSNLKDIRSICKMKTHWIRIQSNIISNDSLLN